MSKRSSETARTKVLQTEELAKCLARLIDEKKGQDIIIFDLKGLSPITDYFVICNGESTRQIKTIYEEIEHILKKEGILPHHHEGTLESGWLLLDFGDVIIHIFAPVERDFYNLDELWSKASTLLRIQ